MRTAEILLMALHSLRINKLRSLLTALGIIIGVAAVIILVALGTGMRTGFDAQFSQTANQITVGPAPKDGPGQVPAGTKPRNLTDQDVAALRDPERAPDIASVTPAMTGAVNLAAGQATEKASLLGATANYLDISARSMAAGTWFTQTQISTGAKDVVLGQQAVGYLWGPTTNLATVVGKQVRLAHTTFRVVGVLSADGQNDNQVIVPFNTARAHLVGNADEVSQIIVKATSTDTVAQASNELTTILDERHLIKNPTAQDFTVHTLQTLIDKRNQFITFLTLFTTAIAAISLVVGGIGVANIMLVAVSERTREIGIRKAIGATRRAVLAQFLTESVVLTGLGGLVGVALGVGSALLGAALIPRLAPSFPSPVLTTPPVLVAFAVSLLIGVAAGGLPANRAARLRPIEALRAD